MLYLTILSAALLSAFYISYAYQITSERNAWKRASKHNYGLFHASQERLHSAAGDLHSAKQDLELASADLADAEEDLMEVEEALSQASGATVRLAEQLHAAEIDAKYWKAKADEFRDLIPDEEITEITAVLEVPAVPPPLPKGAKKWTKAKNKGMSKARIEKVAKAVSKAAKKIKAVS